MNGSILWSIINYYKLPWSNTSNVNELPNIDKANHVFVRTNNLHSAWEYLVVISHGYFANPSTIYVHIMFSLIFSVIYFKENLIFSLSLTSSFESRNVYLFISFVNSIDIDKTYTNTPYLWTFISLKPRVLSSMAF